MFYWNAIATKCKYQKPDPKKIKTKVVVGASFSREKKGGLYKTHDQLLSEKWTVKRSPLHASFSDS